MENSSISDMAKLELIPPINSSGAIKKLVGNYLKLLVAEFDKATNYIIKPDPKTLAQLKSLMTESRFPAHGINLLKKYQRNQQTGAPHKVLRDEIWDMIGEDSIAEFGFSVP